MVEWHGVQGVLDAEPFGGVRFAVESIEFGYCNCVYICEV